MLCSFQSSGPKRKSKTVAVNCHGKRLLDFYGKRLLDFYGKRLLDFYGKRLLDF
jgi:hypothetical protein